MASRHRKASTDEKPDPSTVASVEMSNVGSDPITDFGGGSALQVFDIRDDPAYVPGVGFTIPQGTDWAAEPYEFGSFPNDEVHVGALVHMYLEVADVIPVGTSVSVESPFFGFLTLGDGGPGSLDAISARGTGINLLTSASTSDTTLSPITLVAHLVTTGGPTPEPIVVVGARAAYHIF